MGECLFQAIAMAKRLYVGNLSYTVTSDELQELFEQYVRRLQTDIGTTVNQDAIARIRGGSVE